MITKLLFTTTKAIDSRFIRIFTWSDFSHVDFIWGDEVIGAIAGHGVQICSIAERLSTASKALIVETAADEVAISNLMHSQIGKPYDWSAVIGLGVHRDWTTPDAWFCSEIIAWAHRQIGVNLVNPDVYLNRVTPQMLLQSPAILAKRQS